MTEQTPPPPKRQKTQNEHPTHSIPSSPATPIVVSKAGGNRRIIPDTPGSPPVQVLASSPTPTSDIKPSTTTPNFANIPGLANGNSANVTAMAVAEAMKLANPQIAPGVSVRRPGFPSQTPPSPQNVIPQSPPKPFGNFVQQFGYNPQPQQPGFNPQLQVPGYNPGQQRPQILPAGQGIPPHLLYRPPVPISSIATSYGMLNRPRPVPSLQPRAQPIPSGPIPTNPEGWLPLQGTPLRRLYDMFPNITQTEAMSALTACRGNFEDTAAKVIEGVSFAPIPQPQPQRQVVDLTSQQRSYAPIPMATQTTKRTLKAPTQTIQKKYTHMNDGQMPNTFPYNLAPRPLAMAPVQPFQGPPSTLTQFTTNLKPVQTKKRKLVRGGSRHLDSDGDSLSDSEEEFTSRDEIFDEKVLNFLNTASAEEIGDISFTPAENVKVFVESRPFGSLEIARVVELPPSEDDTAPKKGRGRKATKKGRNVGNRIVDGVEEVLAGYSGVDALITECEAIGKRVREKLGKWTSGIAQDDGALALTAVNPSTPSTATTDPSPAPSDRDPEYIIAQPAILGNDVALKDYQLIGVNWLNLLYKEGLSCILADEMGLGKTCQVIAFLGGLLERSGQRGKHLVVVPSSTLGISPANLLI
jgi:SNF2-related domain